jgi:serine/threonine protein kinase
MGIGTFSVVSLHNVPGFGHVAIKTLPKVVIEYCETVDEIVTEIEILKLIKDKPSFPRFYCARMNESGIQIMMEPCKGGNLEEFLKGRKGVPIQSPLLQHYSAQFLKAVSYLSKIGITHRDIKLANVLFTSEGILKIGDFGLAVHVGSAAAKEKIDWLKHLGHWAPESFEGAWDERSDVWTWAVITAWMALNKEPFEDDLSLVLVKEMSDLSDPHLIDMLMSVFKASRIERPSPKSLKKHRYFNGIDWKQIAVTPPPIPPSTPDTQFSDPEELAKWHARNERIKAKLTPEKIEKAGKKMSEANI